jgi:hypothetical protein
MKRSAFLATLFFLTALPLLADNRHQSYFSYDDGGTLVLQGDDGRELEARVNLPVYPGDEVVTNRRGRSEIRLADGNVIALDRSTSVRVRSVLDAYEGEAQATLLELRYGKLMVLRRDVESEPLRLDTSSASYVASAESLFTVEADNKGRDRVMVFDGQVEVRTPNRRTRLREGDSANVDDRGLYALTSQPRASADDFERWFIQRAARYDDDGDSKYLDGRFSSYDSELRDYGSWVYVGSFGGWVWRPVVSVGWRPYHYGEWVRGGSGCLTWVSYEPWGWLPYHYGRWAYEPAYGWVWLPGSGYAPAWVYWMYGGGYVGWAPAGWYDCYRPYYSWAGRPYQNVTADFGFGFYGRVRVNELDLRPWTFVEPNGLVSGRIDRAALTTDAIRQRLSRDGGSIATISSSPARFTNEQLRDPAAAINGIARRGLGTGTGPGTAPADLTPFFRRDDNVGENVRERIVRSRPTGGSNAGSGTQMPNPGTIYSGSSGGGVAPIGRGEVAPIGRGSVAPTGRGGDTPAEPSTGGRVSRGDWRNEGGSGSGTRIERGNGSSTPATPAPERGKIDRGEGRETVAPTPRESGSDSGESWRGRVARPSGEAPAAGTPAEKPRDDSWRNKPTTGDSGSSDVPRRIIDRIGGARVTSGDSPRSSGGSNRGSGQIDRGSSGSSSSSSGKASTPPPAPAPSSPPPQKSSDSNRGDGGKIKRDH